MGLCRASGAPLTSRSSGPPSRYAGRRPLTSGVRPVEMNRPLSATEEQLVHWMLQHGKPEARSLLPQIARASVTPWHCPCGCASVNFAIQDHVAPQGGLNVLADFVFGNAANLSGIFVYEQSGVLSGLEVYGLAGEAPKVLPSIEVLRPWQDASASV